MTMPIFFTQAILHAVILFLFLYTFIPIWVNNSLSFLCLVFSKPPTLTTMWNSSQWSHTHWVVNIGFISPPWRQSFWSPPSSCSIWQSTSTVQLAALGPAFNFFLVILCISVYLGFFSLSYSFILKHSQLVSLKKWVDGTFFLGLSMTESIFILG